MTTDAHIVAESDPDTSTAPLRPLRYSAPLDGLRAIAVLAVFVFHNNESWLPGGFLGVDLFFVLSGYLITRLLIVENERTGTVDLGGILGTPVSSPVAGIAVGSGRRHVVRVGVGVADGTPCTPRRCALVALLRGELEIHRHRFRLLLLRRGDVTAATHVVARRRGAVLLRVATARCVGASADVALGRTPRAARRDGRARCAVRRADGASVRCVLSFEGLLRNRCSDPSDAHWGRRRDVAGSGCPSTRPMAGARAGGDARSRRRRNALGGGQRSVVLRAGQLRLRVDRRHPHRFVGGSPGLDGRTRAHVVADQGPREHFVRVLPVALADHHLDCVPRRSGLR